MRGMNNVYKISSVANNEVDTSFKFKAMLSERSVS